MLVKKNGANQKLDIYYLNYILKIIKKLKKQNVRIFKSHLGYIFNDTDNIDAEIKKSRISVLYINNAFNNIIFKLQNIKDKYNNKIVYTYIYKHYNKIKKRRIFKNAFYIIKKYVFRNQK